MHVPSRNAAPKSATLRILFVLLSVLGICRAEVADAAKRHPGPDRSASEQPSSDAGAREVPINIKEGVAGLVTDPSGAPLEGVLIQATGVGRAGPIPDIAVVSAADGSFVWNLRPGHYRLDAVLDGRTVASAAVAVKRGAVTNISLRTAN